MEKMASLNVSRTKPMYRAAEYLCLSNDIEGWNMCGVSFCSKFI